MARKRHEDARRRFQRIGIEHEATEGTERGDDDRKMTDKKMGRGNYGRKMGAEEF